MSFNENVKEVSEPSTNARHARLDDLYDFSLKLIKQKGIKRIKYIPLKNKEISQSSKLNLYL